ncbi:T9SS type A sorting domain-containing protein [Yeosuana sp. AK3]
MEVNINPFIDEPDLVEYLWGTQVGNSWSQSLSTERNQVLQIQVYPNPSQDKFYLKGIKTETILELFSIDGKHLKTFYVNRDTFINHHLSKGLYFLKITSEGSWSIKKIMIE